MEMDIKSKIYNELDSIEDVSVLNMVMENVTFYKNKNDILDDLSEEQLKELNHSIAQADNNETISLADFKKEINEWKRK